MTQPNARIYVDPDGVTSTGARYGEHARTYESYLAYVQNLRAQYGSSWGDDEIGREFGASFNGGMDAVEQIVKAAISLIRYTSDGLQTGGREYRTADENAREAGMLLARHADQHLTTEGTPAGTVASTLPSGSFAATPRTPALPATLAATLPSGATAATEQTPALPATLAADESGRLIPAAATSPGEPATWHLTASTPGFSAYDARDLSSAKVDGRPMSEGERLVAFVPLPDGTVQVDANLYETLTPVTSGVVTGPDGQPIDPDGRSFFVVRDASEVDPSAPGYRPLHVSFPAGGNRPVV
ncbi:WXG100 family type VII secretion target [Micromonospora profundi]|uniref:hypothetical protein n=1 Tax=Micromonospora profundi TaxID=1420889 RepID=UPI00368E0008